MNTTATLAETDQWHAQIGRFSLGLGGVEWATDMLLDQAGESRQGLLNSRLNRLKSAAVKLKPELQSAILALVAEAHQIRDKRNSVLHSTVAVNFYIRKDDPDMEVFISTKLNDRFGVHTDIDLPAMIELAQQAEDLGHRFWDIVRLQYAGH